VKPHRDDATVVPPESSEHEMLARLIVASIGVAVCDAGGHAMHQAVGVRWLGDLVEWRGRSVERLWDTESGQQSLRTGCGMDMIVGTERPCLSRWAEPFRPALCSVLRRHFAFCPKKEEQQHSRPLFVVVFLVSLV